MKSLPSRNHLLVSFYSAVLCACCTASALAQGGNVLPANATPNGYSLWDMAALTAVNNVGGSVTPNVPFQVLVGSISAYTVNSGATLYVPVFYTDDSPPVFSPPPFPANINNQAADAQYLDALLLASFGVSGLFLDVDGHTTPITDGYVTGATTAPLPDGGGTDYIVSAAFLSPFAPGQHTVDIGGYINGSPQVFLSDTITSVPDQTSTSVLCVIAGLALIFLRRYISPHTDVVC
jgi:hypothetical protein